MRDITSSPYMTWGFSAAACPIWTPSARFIMYATIVVVPRSIATPFAGDRPSSISHCSPIVTPSTRIFVLAMACCTTTLVLVLTECWHASRNPFSTSSSERCWRSLSDGAGTGSIATMHFPHVPFPPHSEETWSPRFRAASRTEIASPTEILSPDGSNTRMHSLKILAYPIRYLGWGRSGLSRSSRSAPESAASIIAIEGNVIDACLIGP